MDISLHAVTNMRLFTPQTLVFLLLDVGAAASISTAQRRSIVRSVNPHRNASSATTPLQVGNGNFAFGADVTGLQTFSHFAVESSWAWHNFSLPTTTGQTFPSGRYSFLANLYGTDKNNFVRFHRVRLVDA